jgi:hypothetical protein
MIIDYLGKVQVSDVYVRCSQTVMKIRRAQKKDMQRISVKVNDRE